ncbi:hypothetical protein [Streptomyces sp. NPDC085596]|uniref:hypothetical protein n=1 Tax=Streptomyces sp. NPDC085596 TaxID=3365731 RepID=UPI0037D04CEF
MSRPARRGTSPLAVTLHTPLSRWAFTALAILALATGQGWPFEVTAMLAWLAWRRPTRKRRRHH